MPNAGVLRRPVREVLALGVMREVLALVIAQPPCHMEGFGQSLRARYLDQVLPPSRVSTNARAGLRFRIIPLVFLVLSGED